MSDVVEELIGTIVRSGRVSAISEDKLQDLTQTKSVSDTTDQEVLCDTAFISLITNAVGKLADRAVKEGCSRSIEGVSTTTAET